MSVPTRPKKPGKRATKRRSSRARPRPPADAQHPVVELARVLLDRRSRERPPRSFRQTLARLASSWMGLIWLCLLLKLDARWFIGLCSVFLLLVGVLALDHWYFAEKRRARSQRRDSLPKPPSQAPLDQCTDPDPPHRAG